MRGQIDSRPEASPERVNNPGSLTATSVSSKTASNIEEDGNGSGSKITSSEIIKDHSSEAIGQLEDNILSDNESENSEDEGDEAEKFEVRSLPPTKCSKPFCSNMHHPLLESHYIRERESH